jgi:hypothetical protein
MGYWLNGGMIGICAILFLSLALTPAFCSSMKQKYADVSCKLEDDLNTFYRIFMQGYFILLLTLCFASGGLIGRVFDIVKNKDEERLRRLTEKTTEKSGFKWMWERK